MRLHTSLLMLTLVVTVIFATLQCGDDEVACPLPATASPMAGKCIDECDWCDAKPNDCPGNKDETDCGADDCKDGLFHCDTKCIRNTWRCDNIDDCVDETDEKNCTDVDSCGDKLYFCSTDRKCIPEEWRCDGINDCPMANEDESQCVEKRCAETDRFFCPMEEKCVSEYRRCDYNLDCYDAADEKNCKADDCREGYFHCPISMKCIPKNYVCDGELDCVDDDAPFHNPGDYSDEEACKECNRGAFKCPNQDKCISPMRKCDGYPDCEKGEEDHGCSCNKNTMFECYNYQCVDGNDVCDGTCDCADGSDENGFGCPYSAQCRSAVYTKKRISKQNNTVSTKMMREWQSKKSIKKSIRNDIFKPSRRISQSDGPRRFSNDRVISMKDDKEYMRGINQERIDEYRRNHDHRTRVKIGNPTYTEKLTNTKIRKLQALLTAIRRNLNK